MHDGFAVRRLYRGGDAAAKEEHCSAGMRSWAGPAARGPVLILCIGVRPTQTGCAAANDLHPSIGQGSAVLHDEWVSRYY
jgi:hypothetical protein